MNIVVVGNCQAPILARILSWINGGVHVSPVPIHTLQRNMMNDAASKIDGADLVVTQPIHGEYFGPLRTTEWIGKKRLVIVPNVFFEGHLPDCCYVGGMSGRVKSPVGEYHSIIALKAFLEGRSAEETEALYNRETFERFGYLDLVDQSWAELELRAKRLDVNWAPLLSELKALGVFTYTVNHPDNRAMLAVACHAARELGIPLEDSKQDLQRYFVDELSTGIVLPVFPEIAAHHGLDGRGSRNYRGSRQRNYPMISLGQMIRESFEIYAAENRDKLAASGQRARKIVSDIAFP